MNMIDRGLSDEQRMMRENRPSRELLEEAQKIGVRTLGIPEEFGGTPVDPATEVQTFAMVAEEISRGDPGLGDKLTQIWKISKLLRDASLFLHRDATVDISRFKIVKAMFPDSAGVYAGPEK